MCQTCNDERVLITDFGYGMTMKPCPDCNDGNFYNPEKCRALKAEILAKMEEAKNDNPN